MSVDLFRIDHDELRQIWRDIEQSDGVITPEQELRINELMAERLGLIANAVKCAELQASVEQLKRWVAEAQARYRTWEYTIGRIRHAMLEPLKGILPEAHMPKGLKSITTQAKTVRIGLRQNHSGRLDPNDPALDHEKTIKGYTKEQMEKSEIGGQFFEERTVYVLKRDELADEVRIVESSKVKRPARVGLARLDYEPTVVLTVLGGSAGGKRSRSSQVAESEASGA